MDRNTAQSLCWLAIVIVILVWLVGCTPPTLAAEAPKGPAIRLAPPIEGTMPNVTPVIPDSVKRPIIFPIKQKPRWI